MNKQCSRYYSDADFFKLELPQRTQQCLSVRVGGDGLLFRTMRQKIADLLAVVPKNADCRIETVGSPLQCPAPVTNCNLKHGD